MLLSSVNQSKVTVTTSNAVTTTTAKAVEVDYVSLNDGSSIDSKSTNDIGVETNALHPINATKRWLVIR